MAEHKVEEESRRRRTARFWNARADELVQQAADRSLTLPSHRPGEIDRIEVSSHWLALLLVEAGYADPLPEPEAQEVGADVH